MGIAGVTRQCLLKPCLLLLAGGLAAQHTTSLLHSDALSLLLVASICALGLPRARAIAYCTCGFALFQLAGASVIDARLDPEYAGDSMLTTVRIVDFPERNRGSLVMRAEPVDDHRIPPRIRISWFEPPFEPALGDIWEFELRLRRPRGNLNPGGFDYESWLFREKVHATGYVVNGQRNRLVRTGEAGAVDEFRKRFLDRAAATAPAPEEAAVLAAIGVGARHGISRSQWDRYARTGTSHLMAISGLHVGLAAMAGFLLAFPLIALSRLAPNHYLAAVLCGAGFAGAYAVVSGFGVPARRAVLMLLFAAATIVRRRQLEPAAIVALTAALVFVFDPIASLAPGFYLSFGAVVLLLWLGRRRVAARGPALSHVGRLATIQVFLLFGLAPLTVLLFQRLALLSIPVNLVAVPVFSLLTVPLVLGGVVLGDVAGGAAAGLLRLASLSVAAVDTLVVAAADLPHTDNTIAAIVGPAWLFVLLPLAWVLLPRGWPCRGVAVIGLFALLSWKPPSPPAGCFDTWVLDVGQGLAIAVETRAGTALYDTGLTWRGGGSVAERIIRPFLDARGIRRVAHLVVSHADLDHSGGARYLQETLEIGQILAGEQLSGVAAASCVRGMGWRSGGVLFEVLHPPMRPGLEGNDASCVLRVSAGAHSVLLTGDIEARAERSLVRSESSLRADVVVVPHHGSLTSSTAAFVDAVQPGVAVVSASFRNRWGFPRPAVVSRWQEAGARVLNTAADGAVRLRVCADRGVVAVSAERERRRRFWHAAAN